MALPRSDRTSRHFLQARLPRPIVAFDSLTSLGRISAPGFSHGVPALPAGVSIRHVGVLRLLGAPRTLHPVSWLPQVVYLRKMKLWEAQEWWGP